MCGERSQQQQRQARRGLVLFHQRIHGLQLRNHQAAIHLGELGAHRRGVFRGVAVGSHHPVS
jgi:hypothetical protein